MFKKLLISINWHFSLTKIPQLETVRNALTMANAGDGYLALRIIKITSLAYTDFNIDKMYLHILALLF